METAMWWQNAKDDNETTALNNLLKEGWVIVFEQFLVVEDEVQYFARLSFEEDAGKE